MAVVLCHRRFHMFTGALDEQRFRRPLAEGALLCEQLRAFRWLYYNH